MSSLPLSSDDLKTLSNDLAQHRDADTFWIHSSSLSSVVSPLRTFWIAPPSVTINDCNQSDIFHESPGEFGCRSLIRAIERATPGTITDHSWIASFDISPSDLRDDIDRAVHYIMNTCGTHVTLFELILRKRFLFSRRVLLASTRQWLRRLTQAPEDPSPPASSSIVLVPSSPVTLTSYAHKSPEFKNFFQKFNCLALFAMVAHQCQSDSTALRPIIDVFLSMIDNTPPRALEKEDSTIINGFSSMIVNAIQSSMCVEAIATKRLMPAMTALVGISVATYSLRQILITIRCIIDYTISNSNCNVILPSSNNLLQRFEQVEESLTSRRIAFIRIPDGGIRQDPLFTFSISKNIGCKPGCDISIESSFGCLVAYEGVLIVFDSRCGLFKVGSGRRGSIRGIVYRDNAQFPRGSTASRITIGRLKPEEGRSYLAYSNGFLFFRCRSTPAGCVIVCDAYTLQELGIVRLCGMKVSPGIDDYVNGSVASIESLIDPRANATTRNVSNRNPSSDKASTNNVSVPHKLSDVGFPINVFADHRYVYQLVIVKTVLPDDSLSFKLIVEVYDPRPVIRAYSVSGSSDDSASDGFGRSITLSGSIADLSVLNTITIYPDLSGDALNEYMASFIANIRRISIIATGDRFIFIDQKNPIIIRVFSSITGKQLGINASGGGLPSTSEASSMASPTMSFCYDCVDDFVWTYCASNETFQRWDYAGPRILITENDLSIQDTYPLVYYPLSVEDIRMYCRSSEASQTLSLDCDNMTTIIRLLTTLDLLIRRGRPESGYPSHLPPPPSLHPSTDAGADMTADQWVRLWSDAYNESIPLCLHIASSVWTLCESSINYSWLYIMCACVRLLDRILHSCYRPRRSGLSDLIISVKLFLSKILNNIPNQKRIYSDNVIILGALYSLELAAADTLCGLIPFLWETEREEALLLMNIIDVAAEYVKLSDDSNQDRISEICSKSQIGTFNLTFTGLVADTYCSCDGVIDSLLTQVSDSEISGSLMLFLSHLVIVTEDEAVSKINHICVTCESTTDVEQLCKRPLTEAPIVSPLYKFLLSVEKILALKAVTMGPSSSIVSFRIANQQQLIEYFILLCQSSQRILALTNSVVTRINQKCLGNEAMHSVFTDVLETTLQSSILGTSLPSLCLTFLDSEIIANLLKTTNNTFTTIIKKMFSEFEDLAHSIAQTVKLFPKGTNDDTLYAKHASLKKHELRKQIVESSHPYERGDQLVHQVVTFSNASGLILEFDSRCCTVLDNDCVSVFAPMTAFEESDCRTATRSFGQVISFSGNPASSDSKWSRGEDVIVKGDTVLISFAARSHPEGDASNRWGFRVTIREIPHLDYSSMFWLLDTLNIIVTFISHVSACNIMYCPMDSTEFSYSSWLQSALFSRGLESAVASLSTFSAVASIELSDPFIVDMLNGQGVAGQLVNSTLAFVRRGPGLGQQSDILEAAERAVFAAMLKSAGLLSEVKRQAIHSDKLDILASVNWAKSEREIVERIKQLRDWITNRKSLVGTWECDVEECLNEGCSRDDIIAKLRKNCNFNTVKTIFEIKKLPYNQNDGWNVWLNMLADVVEKDMADLRASQLSTDSVRLAPLDRLCNDIIAKAKFVLLLRSDDDVDLSVATTVVQSGLQPISVFERSVSAHATSLPRSLSESFPRTSSNKRGPNVTDFRAESIPEDVGVVPSPSIPLFLSTADSNMPRSSSLTAVSTHDNQKVKEKAHAALVALHGRVKNFRNSLAAYKRWKKWQETARELDSSCTNNLCTPNEPFSAVFAFIRSTVDPNVMFSLLRRRNDRANARARGLEMLSKYLKLSSLPDSSRFQLIATGFSALQFSALSSFDEKQVCFYAIPRIMLGIDSCSEAASTCFIHSFSEFFQQCVQLLKSNIVSHSIRLAVLQMCSFEFVCENHLFIRKSGILGVLISICRESDDNESTTYFENSIFKRLCLASWSAISLLALRFLGSEETVTDDRQLKSLGKFQYEIYEILVDELLRLSSKSIDSPSLESSLFDVVYLFLRLCTMPVVSKLMSKFMRSRDAIVALLSILETQTHHSPRVLSVSLRLLCNLCRYIDITSLNQAVEELIARRIIDQPEESAHANFSPLMVIGMVLQVSEHLVSGIAVEPERQDRQCDESKVHMESPRYAVYIHKGELSSSIVSEMLGSVLTVDDVIGEFRASTSPPVSSASAVRSDSTSSNNSRTRQGLLNLLSGRSTLEAIFGMMDNEDLMNERGMMAEELRILDSHVAALLRAANVSSSAISQSLTEALMPPDISRSSSVVPITEAVNSRDMGRSVSGPTTTTTSNTISLEKKLSAVMDEFDTCGEALVMYGTDSVCEAIIAKIANLGVMVSIREYSGRLRFFSSPTAYTNVVETSCNLKVKPSAYRIEMSGQVAQALVSECCHLLQVLCSAKSLIPWRSVILDVLNDTFLSLTMETCSMDEILIATACVEVIGERPNLIYNGQKVRVSRGASIDDDTGYCKMIYACNSDEFEQMATIVQYEDGSNVAAVMFDDKKDRHRYVIPVNRLRVVTDEHVDGSILKCLPQLLHAVEVQLNRFYRRSTDDDHAINWSIVARFIVSGLRTILSLVEHGSDFQFIETQSPSFVQRIVDISESIDTYIRSAHEEQRWLNLIRKNWELQTEFCKRFRVCWHPCTAPVPFGTPDANDIACGARQARSTVLDQIKEGVPLSTLAETNEMEPLRSVKHKLDHIFGFRKSSDDTSDSDKERGLLLEEYYQTEVVPALRRYLANEFSASEWDDFIAQIMMQIRSGNLAEARNIVTVLCNSNVPSNIRQLLSKDVEALQKASLKIGSIVPNMQLKVTSTGPSKTWVSAGSDPRRPSSLRQQSGMNSARDAPLTVNVWIDDMAETMERVGTVVDIDKKAQLVLLRFYDSETGQLRKFWYSLSQLSKLDENCESSGSVLSSAMDSPAMAVYESDRGKLMADIIHSSSILISGYCRRFISNIIRTRRDFVITTLDRRQTFNVRRVLDWTAMEYFRGVPQLQSLCRLYEPSFYSNKQWSVLQQVAQEFIESEGVVAAITLVSDLLKTCGDRSCQFAQTIHVGAGDADLLPKFISVGSSAAAAMIIFDRDGVSLLGSSSLEFFLSSSCSEAVLVLKPHPDNGLCCFPPLVIQSAEFFVKIQSSIDNINGCKYRFFVAPLDPSLGLALYFVNVLCKSALYQLSNGASEAKEVTRAVTCDQLKCLYLQLETFLDVAIVSEPLKEVVFCVISSLVNVIVTVFAASSTAVNMTPNSRLLGRLLKEATQLYDVEKSRDELHSSYLQCLLELLVVLRKLQTQQDSKSICETSFVYDDDNLFDVNLVMSIGEGDKASDGSSSGSIKTMANPLWFSQYEEATDIIRSFMSQTNIIANSNVIPLPPNTINEVCRSFNLRKPEDGIILVSNLPRILCREKINTMKIELRALEEKLASLDDSIDCLVIDLTEQERLRTVNTISSSAAVADAETSVSSTSSVESHSSPTISPASPSTSLRSVQIFGASAATIRPPATTSVAASRATSNRRLRSVGDFFSSHYSMSSDGGGVAMGRLSSAPASSSASASTSSVSLSMARLFRNQLGDIADIPSDAVSNSDDNSRNLRAFMRSSAAGIPPNAHRLADPGASSPLGNTFGLLPAEFNQFIFGEDSQVRSGVSLGLSQPEDASGAAPIVNVEEDDYFMPDMFQEPEVIPAVLPSFLLENVELVAQQMSSATLKQSILTLKSQIEREQILLDTVVADVLRVAGLHGRVVLTGSAYHPLPSDSIYHETFLFFEMESSSDVKVAIECINSYDFGWCVGGDKSDGVACVVDTQHQHVVARTFSSALETHRDACSELLRHRMLEPNSSTQLCSKLKAALTEIFMALCRDRDNAMDCHSGAPPPLLSSNSFREFVSLCTSDTRHRAALERATDSVDDGGSSDDLVSEAQSLVLSRLECEVNDWIPLSKFLDWFLVECLDRPLCAWRALRRLGYDLHFDVLALLQQQRATDAMKDWSADMDAALIHFLKPLGHRRLPLDTENDSAAAVSKFDGMDFIDPLTIRAPASVDYIPSSTSSMNLEGDDDDDEGAGGRLPDVSSPDDIVRNDFPALKHLSSCMFWGVLRFRFALLLRLNALLVTALPLIDLSRSMEGVHAPGATIAAALSTCRGSIFPAVKASYLARLFDETATRGIAKVPVITVDRIRMASKRQSGDTNIFATTNFGAAISQLARTDAALLRPPKPRGADPFFSIEVEYNGENVVGKMGPYRQYFMDIAKEIQSTELTPPVLMITPNNEDKVGDNRHHWMPVPSARRPTDLHHYFVFGRLLGCAVRTGVLVPLFLPSIFWKPLSGQPLTLKDLYGVDKQAVAAFRFLERLIDDEEAFNDSVDETFSTVLSDRTTLDLIPGGSTIPVKYSDCRLYVELLKAARLGETACQTRAILSGMVEIVPRCALALFGWKELELLICGGPTIDINLLRRHTIYSGDPNAPHIEFFWTVLEGFSQEARRRFLHFAWAQDRLPVDDSEFQRRNVRMMIKPRLSDGGCVDDQLPRVDTCFFNVELPAYSSVTIMRQRLTTAIEVDVDAMDADDVAAVSSTQLYYDD